MECSLCLYVAEMAEDYLNQNKTKEEIEQELLLVCNLFPNKLQDQCLSCLKEYAQYVIDLIDNELDPRMTCTSLNLCDPKSTLTDLSKTLKKLNNNNNKNKWY